MSTSTREIIIATFASMICRYTSVQLFRFRPWHMTWHLVFFFCFLGQPKEIELVKTEDALGLTITDNGAGYAFIKRIKDGSVIDKVKVIQVGDHIEKINEHNLIGRRHFEVAKMLKDIPKGATFALRLVEPQKSGFGSIGPRGDIKKGKKPTGYGSGRETLRFKADGSAQIEKVVRNLKDALDLHIHPKA